MLSLARDFEVTDFDGDTFEMTRYPAGAVVVVTRTTKKGKRKQSAVWLNPDQADALAAALRGA